MTVEATTRRVSYNGTGAQTAFPVTFKFFDDDELLVIERVTATGVETTKTLTTHYTVTGGRDADGHPQTGTVTAVTAPATGVSWTILGDTTPSQTVDYTPFDPFPANTHEGTVDRLTMLHLEQQVELDRALKYPRTDPSGLSTTLPSSVDRANRLAGYDATGAPTTYTQDQADSDLVTPTGGTQARTLAASLSDFETLPQYAGIMGDGSASDQVGLVAAYAAKDVHGRALWFPPRGSVSYYKAIAALSINRKNGQTFRGGGRRASRLHQTTANTTLMRADHDWATGTSNGLDIRDMFLSAATTASSSSLDTHAVVYLEGANRSTISDSHLSGGKFAIHTKDTLSLQMVKLSGDSSGYFFFNDGSGLNSGPNHTSMISCYWGGALNLAVSSYAAFGWALVGNCMESCAAGGLTIGTAGGGFFEGGGYYEQNTDGVGKSHDSHIGSGSYVYGSFRAAVYHNGRQAGAGYDYTPIRKTFAVAHHEAWHYFNAGNRAVAFESGATVSNSQFGPNGFAAAFDLSDPETVYQGIPLSFLDNDNTIDEPQVIPWRKTNLFRGNAFSFATSGTVVRSSDRIKGSLALDFTGPGAVGTRTLAGGVSATTNSEVRGKICHAWIDVYIADAAANLRLTLNDGATTTTRNVSGFTGEKRFHIHKKFSATATAFVFAAEVTTAHTIKIGDCGAAIGMAPKYSQNVPGIPDFAATDLSGADAAYNPGSIAAAATVVGPTFSAPLARQGDHVLVSFDETGGTTANAELIRWWGNIKPAGTVNTFGTNEHTAAVDPTIGTLRYRIIAR